MPNLTLTPKTLKLTQKSIDDLPAPHPSGKQVLYWHPGLPGFGVLTSGKTSTKSYIVQKRLPNGKSPRITLGSTSVLSVDEALEKGRRHLVQMSGPEAINPKAEKKRAKERDKTLEIWFDTYLKHSNDLRLSTRRQYSFLVRTHLKPWLGRPLRSITPTEVVDRHIELSTEVGKASANVAFKVFRAIWNHALDMDDTGSFPANPCRRLKKTWHRIKPRTRHVNSDQLPAFYRAVLALENTSMRDFILVMLFTGLRKNECAALNWDEHIDFPNKAIRIPAPDTKTDQKLTLPMSTYVYELLMKRRSVGIDGSGFVFPSTDSRSGHVTQPRNFFKQIQKRSGIFVSSHDLRRSFITVAESSDISETALKALVNHSLGSNVTAGYVQMQLERLREPTQTVCDLMMRLCKIAPPTTNVTRFESTA